jgi:hypothetical protein
MKLVEQEAFDDLGAVLGVLTDDPNKHWAWAELQLLFMWPPHRLNDALDELVRDGLVHKHDWEYWATHAASRCRYLLA